MPRKGPYDNLVIWLESWGGYNRGEIGIGYRVQGYEYHEPQFIARIPNYSVRRLMSRTDKAIRELPPKPQKAIRLRFIGTDVQLKNTEVAEALDITVSAVEKRLRAAYKALKPQINWIS